MELFRRRAQVSTVALQIYMVAGSYRCPILRAGGFRIDPRALGSSLATMADDSCKPGAAKLPLFPGDQPPEKHVSEWMKDALTTLSNDGSALVTKTEPSSPSLTRYRNGQIPEALVIDTVTGVTSLANETRDATRWVVGDANALTMQHCASLLWIILHSVYREIVAAVGQKDPLLTRELNVTCKQNTGQVDSLDELLDGCNTWNKAANMDMTIPRHHNVWLNLVDPLPGYPLPNNSTSLDFIEHIINALEHGHYYFERINMSSVEWVLSQTPVVHGDAARAMFDALDVDEKNNPIIVASRISEVMSDETLCGQSPPQLTLKNARSEHSSPALKRLQRWLGGARASMSKIGRRCTPQP